MLWVLKVPILGQLLRKGIKKAGFVFFLPTPACGTQAISLWNTDYCWSSRQITQFLWPSHLASHSLPQYANRENTFEQNVASSAQVPEKVSQVSVIRDEVQGEQLSAMNWMKVDSGLPWEDLIPARPQDGCECEEIAVWGHWKAYFCHS